MSSARLLLSSLGLSLLALSPAQAQSGASRASQALSESVSALPKASGALLVEGGRFSVAALRPLGASAELVLVGASDGARFSVQVTGRALEASGVVVGTVLVATAVSGGYLLWAGSEAVAFVLEPRLAEHVHRRELQP